MVVVVLVAGLVIFVDRDEHTPADGARDFYRAAFDQDCDAYLAAITEESRATMGDSRDQQLDTCERSSETQGGGPADPRLGPVDVESQDGDVARLWVVVFSEDYEAGNNAFPVTVVREDGEWRVDLTAEDWSDDG